jgi:signal transduction histidine kinase
MKRDILYVDDEHSNLIVFEAAFEDVFNVHTARSAEEALTFLESHAVPVVVADQRMPDMTGVEMFALMRNVYPHTQRVILSGFADSEAIIDAINQGQIYQFVRKPWQRVELLTVLQRALDAHDLSLQNSVLTERLLVSERCAMLGQATGRIAHEMANQLNVLPLVELIEDEYADDEQLRQLAEVARKTHERLLELVQPLPLSDSIHELVSFLRFNRSIPYERLQVDIRRQPVVRGNKLKLHQVLVNLIRNAADAIAGRPDGRIQLILDQDEDQAVISVLDNGCGIPREELDRIWEPFYTTKGSSGNGMGLDIARRLVEAHSGAITCLSAVDKGTTFTLRLPVASAAETATVPRPAAGRASRPVPT